MDKYRNMTKITKEQAYKVLNKINPKDIETVRGGNNYASFLKIYILSDRRSHYKPMFIYAYASVKDPKSIKRSYKPIDFFINPIYKNLLEENNGQI